MGGLASHIKIMKVKIDKEVCIGCGSCVAICPDVFELNDNNKAEVKEEESGSACIKEAEEICPVDAIKVLD